MSTITPDQQSSIASTLAGMPVIPSGLGTRESACSITAINLALSGTLTDTIPDCMSSVIGQWIIRIQDAMPADMRNSACWRGLLPLAAGTGRTCERERLAIAIDWMWGTVLPLLQPIADKGGYGEPWRTMTTERTQAAAAAAYAYAAADAACAADAAYAAAADAAAAAAAYAAAADAAAAAAAYAAVAYAAARTTFWHAADPCACLERMIAVGDTQK